MSQNKKQQEQIQLVVILLVVGAGWYFFYYLPQEKDNSIKEIKELFQKTPVVSPDDLDKKIWKNSDNWEEHFNKLYLLSQLNKFTQKMEEAITERREELKKEARERPIRDLKKAREEAIESIKNTFG